MFLDDPFAADRAQFNLLGFGRLLARGDASISSKNEPSDKQIPTGTH